MFQKDCLMKKTFKNVLNTKFKSKKTKDSY